MFQSLIRFIQFTKNIYEQDNNQYQSLALSQQTNHHNCSLFFILVPLYLHISVKAYNRNLFQEKKKIDQLAVRQ